jgi:hypothetical protein
MDTWSRFPEDGSEMEERALDYESDSFRFCEAECGMCSHACFVEPCLNFVVGRWYCFGFLRVKITDGGEDA